MISPQWIECMADALAKHGLDEQAVATLRLAYPQYHFTYCTDDDVPPRLTPVSQRQKFRVYMVDNSNHCVAFTPNPEAATGLVLAAVSDDE